MNKSILPEVKIESKGLSVAISEDQLEVRSYPMYSVCEFSATPLKDRGLQLIISDELADSTVGIYLDVHQAEQVIVALREALLCCPESSEYKASKLIMSVAGGVR